MTTFTDDTRLLLELYADGEIDERDRARVEEILDAEPAAREYLLALRELTETVRMPIDHALEGVSFDGFFNAVMDQVDTGTTAVLERSADMEILAMAYADGEVRGAAERERVETYLKLHKGAREGLEAIDEIGQLTRMPIEAAIAEVDFDALARRIDDAVGAEISERGGFQIADTNSQTSAPTLWQRITAFFGAHKPVFASALASALVVAIMVPILTSNNDTGTVPTANGGGETIINNYYYGAESVDYQPGFWGSSQPGNIEEGIAPVIWIAPEQPAKIQPQAPPADSAPENDGDVPL